MGIDILTLAAARAGKGSGGSASKYKQPDWGSEVAEVEILPQTSFGADQSQGGVWTSTSPLLEHLEVGKEYTVNWNGKNYSCTAYAGNDCVLIGNGSLFGVVDETTDDPFVFMELPENVQQGAGMYAQLCAGDGSTNATISIKAVDKVYHKIPGEYVGGVGKYKQPEWGVEDGAEVLAEFVIALEDGQAMISAFTKIPTIGNVYTVNWNGTAYTCTAFDVNNGVSMVALGNVAAFGGEDTGEPFAILAVPEDMIEAAGTAGMIMALDGSESVTLSITGEAVHAIPEKFLEKTNEPLFVTFLEDQSTIDKTYEQIKAAIDENRVVTLVAITSTTSSVTKKVWLPLIAISATDDIAFLNPLRNNHILIAPDGTIRSEQLN